MVIATQDSCPNDSEINDKRRSEEKKTVNFFFGPKFGYGG
jgi:hypothetical protein